MKKIAGVVLLVLGVFSAFIGAVGLLSTEIEGDIADKSITAAVLFVMAALFFWGGSRLLKLRELNERHKKGHRNSTALALHKKLEAGKEKTRRKAEFHQQKAEELRRKDKQRKEEYRLGRQQRQEDRERSKHDERRDFEQKLHELDEKYQTGKKQREEEVALKKQQRNERRQQRADERERKRLERQRMYEERQKEQRLRKEQRQQEWQQTKEEYRRKREELKQKRQQRGVTGTTGAPAYKPPVTWKRLFYPEESCRRNNQDTWTIYLLEKKQDESRALIDSLVDKYGLWRGAADIVPEPHNRHDRRAMKATINGQYLGYFSMDPQEEVRHFYSRGGRQVDLLIYAPSWAKRPMVYMGKDADTLTQLAKEKYQKALKDERRIWLKETKKYKDVLEATAIKYNGTAPCTISVDEQPSGKYKGGPRLTINVDNIGVVSVIAARWEKDNQVFFDQVLAGTTTGTLQIGYRKDGTHYGLVQLDD